MIRKSWLSPVLTPSVGKMIRTAALPVAGDDFGSPSSCHADRSGFDGPWTFSPISFTNEYYKLLLDEKWQLKKWKGPLQYEDKKTKSLMMLATDMALTTDKEFRKYTELYAKDSDKFFEDFSKSFAKMIELGVPEKNWGGREPMILKSTGED